ncbi:uncharacterized protein LOC663525 [Tribolium castaneum]|uniref:Uncharacterized protein n=1 Tax=Tribolium castaneum TaxID=7070 RepID=D6WH15_TRICA|nr:PREDICTED: uncharacterized protein LOC663525 [Tribolium castaneum]EFA00618.1 hypothetical protein TcasGA2_TC003494 [Tribolium castaneum]|eukprot:XP_974658.1 PREDICTED: uncharacterized protein LOC663525 [Tribolium castaneum]
MPASEEKKLPITCRLGLKPLTFQNVLFYYAPIQGVVSYTSLSVNVMNPSLVLRLFPRRDITNILLVNSLVGSGLYLYNRPHLSTLAKKERVLYSAFGAITFSLGSVLIWAILRSVVPENVPLCTICGVGSGLAMIKLGRGYVDHVDSLVKP